MINLFYKKQLITFRTFKLLQIRTDYFYLDFLIEEEVNIFAITSPVQHNFSPSEMVFFFATKLKKKILYFDYDGPRVEDQDVNKIALGDKTGTFGSGGYLGGRGGHGGRGHGGRGGQGHGGRGAKVMAGAEAKVTAGAEVKVTAVKPAETLPSRPSSRENNRPSRLQRSRSYVRIRAC